MLVSALTMGEFIFAAGPFEPGDWVNYRDCRYVYSCDVGRSCVYFGTGGGITRWDIYRLRWDEPMTIAHLPGEYAVFDTVYSVAYDENTGYLWCGTTDGLFAYASMSGDWDRHILPLGNPNVLSIGITIENIWVEGGTAPGVGVRMLFKGSPTSGAFNTSSPGELEAAGMVDWRGERAELPQDFPVYFINRPGMIYNYEGVLSDTRFNRYHTTCMLDDGRGYTWVGFGGYGAGRADGHTRRMDLYVAGPESSAVKSFVLDDNDIWMGGRGLAHWRRDNDSWEHFRALENIDFQSGRIEDIFIFDNLVYLATNLGLTIYNRKSGRFRTLESLDNLWDSHVTALDSDGERLWIGTAQGVNYLNLSDNRIYRVENIKGRYIYDIEIDGSFVWVGTEYGLFLHDRETDFWTYVRGTDEMQDSEVRDIHISNNEVWLARYLGVEMFDKTTGEWKAYSAVFYRNHTARSILPADSIVWVGTDGGLVKFDRNLNRWVTFTTEDGLPHNTIDIIRREGDYLWLGTPNGLCRFYWNDPYRLD